MTIGAYRLKKKLKIAELAELLGCSEGHASDICNGNQPVSVKIAKRMGVLTGKPWHTFMDADAGMESAKAPKARVG